APVPAPPPAAAAGGGPAPPGPPTSPSAAPAAPPNAPPVLSSLGPKLAVTGQPLQVAVRAADIDQEPLTYRLSGLPAAATLTAGAVYGTATLDWSPAPGDEGTYTVTVTVTDGGNGVPARALSHRPTFPLVVPAT